MTRESPALHFNIFSILLFLLEVKFGNAFISCYDERKNFLRMLLLFFFAFLAGIATILAPCIWPLLPIILSATADGKKWKPLGIVTGIGGVFTLSTLLLASLFKTIPLEPADLRIVGVGIIGFFGLMLLVPAWGRVFEFFIARITSLGGTTLHQKGKGFFSGLILGSALGVIWSPCAGPILGTVATLAASQPIHWALVLLTLVFVAGVVTPLYFLAVLGQKVFKRLHGITPYTGFIQRIFGGIMILAAVMLYTGYDQVLKSKAVETYPACEAVTNPFESNPLVEEGLQTLRLRGQE